MTVDFQPQGQDFNAINGGPQCTFTEAISLLVNCESQDEVDECWDKLSVGGETGPCGWLKDKDGPSWQMVPVALNDDQRSRPSQVPTSHPGNAPDGQAGCGRTAPGLRRQLIHRGRR